ncbi:MAG: LysR family transcriptional regulator [Rhodobacteraceae bacterium]|nr:LysR family transcriptional regulator [Paracoccaceae bacterium]
MAKSLPPLTWFRAFEAAARQLSFTAAATEIGLTQSAVSQQVKSLEMRLGVALFSRHARGLSLTDEGRKLLPQVGAALETLAAATDSFDAAPSENLLTIATSGSVAQWIIAPHLTDFTQRYPDIRLRFLSAVWPDDFHSARANVEIRFGSEKQVGSNAIALTPNRLIALKSPRLTGPLADLPLIETVGTSDGWKAWNQNIGGDLKPKIFADSYGMALHMAMHGNGVALVSALLAEHGIQSGLLVSAHEASIAGKEGFYLSVNKSSAAAVAFGEWFLARISR